MNVIDAINSGKAFRRNKGNEVGPWFRIMRVFEIYNPYPEIDRVGWRQCTMVFPHDVCADDWEVLEVGRVEAVSKPQTEKE